MKTTVFFLLLIFMTCKAQKSQNSDSHLELVANDPYSGIEVAETLVIRDAKSLQKFYSQINRTRKPGLPVPDVDFSKDMVIIRCNGITDVAAVPPLFVAEETEHELVLGMEEMDKDPNASAVTTPFSAYKMPLTKKEVTLRE